MDQFRGRRQACILHEFTSRNFSGVGAGGADEGRHVMGYKTGQEVVGDVAGGGPEKTGPISGLSWVAVLVTLPLEM